MDWSKLITSYRKDVDELDAQLVLLAQSMRAIRNGYERHSEWLESKEFADYAAERKAIDARRQTLIQVIHDIESLA